MFKLKLFDSDFAEEEIKENDNETKLFKANVEKLEFQWKPDDDTFPVKYIISHEFNDQPNSSINNSSQFL